MPEKSDIVPLPVKNGSNIAQGKPGARFRGMGEVNGDGAGSQISGANTVARRPGAGLQRTRDPCPWPAAGVQGHHEAASALVPITVQVKEAHRPAKGGHQSWFWSQDVRRPERYFPLIRFPPMIAARAACWTSFSNWCQDAPHPNSKILKMAAVFRRSGRRTTWDGLRSGNAFDPGTCHVLDLIFQGRARHLAGLMVRLMIAVIARLIVISNIDFHEREPSSLSTDDVDETILLRSGRCDPRCCQ